MAAVVVSLIEHRFRETIAILRHLVRMALQGRVTGLAMCFRLDGRDEYVFTGDFKTDNACALKAANRISWKMNQAADALEELEA